MPKINYLGMELRNPVIVSSATPTISVEGIKKAAYAGAGAVVTKSVIFPEKNGRPAGGLARPRFQLFNQTEGYDPVITEKGGMFSLFRLGEPYPTPDKMSEMLEKIKKSRDIDIPIIVSICGSPSDYEEWRKLARMMEDAGADALELNMHAYPEIRYTDPLFVKVVKDEVKIPVVCKLMAINDDPKVVGPKVELEGADAIAALGTFGFRAMEIDIYQQKPWMEKAHGLGGTWLRAVSLAYVESLYRSVKVPISGVTGILTWQDAVKYILVGATTVQICAAIYAKGYKVIKEIAEGIDSYMNSYGYKTLDDFKGNALKNMKELEYAPPVRAIVNEDKCTGCSKCAEICMFDAITIKDKKANISDKCDGCGLCWSYCPRRAIELYRYE
ncbi:MAG TPA: 4Fe-4S binding protein [Clostridiaceae bacterium]|nr:4Fe-4S binding protein [Clostridiaceae bacterium]